MKTRHLCYLTYQCITCAMQCAYLGMLDCMLELGTSIDDSGKRSSSKTALGMTSKDGRVQATFRYLCVVLWKDLVIWEKFRGCGKYCMPQRLKLPKLPNN